MRRHDAGADAYPVTGLDRDRPGDGKEDVAAVDARGIAWRVRHKDARGELGTEPPAETMERAGPQRRELDLDAEGAGLGLRQVRVASVTGSARSCKGVR